MTLSPVAVFVYRRAAHAARVLEALARNPEARQTELFIFSDAARSASTEADVRRVRDVVRQASGFRSVTIKERPHNFGLARSITSGVDELTARFGRVIVLEDDLVPAVGFLAYMNAGLDRYANDTRVISVHAYCYPVREPLPETFFLRGADCWGWATWRRGWELFDRDGARLLEQVRSRGLERELDLDNSYPYTQMLMDAVASRNDSWAVCWYASAFLRGLLTLYPGVSQVQNIGADGTGSNVSSTDVFSHAQWGRPVTVAEVPVEESAQARAAFARFLRSIRPSLSARIASRARRAFAGLMTGRV